MFESEKAVLISAKKVKTSDPHLANYMLRDLVITKDSGMDELSWSMHKDNYISEQDVDYLIEKIEEYSKTAVAPPPAEWRAS